MIDGARSEDRTVLQASIRIARPASEVFAFVSDLENYPRWFPGIGKMAAVDSSPIGTIGKRYAEVAYLRTGQVADITVEIVEFVAGERFAMHASLEPILPRFDYRFVAAGEDACDFHWRCTRRAQTEAAIQMVGPMREGLGPRLHQALENLKLRLEKRPGMLMAASVARRFGPAKEVIDHDDAFPRVSPGASQVLVRQAASSINRIDVARRNGYGRAMFHHRGLGGFPLMLGCDVCGVVVETGEKVSRFRKGDRVFGAKGADPIGAFAEFVPIDEGNVTLAPEGVGITHLAATPYVFLTAWAGLVDGARLTPATARGKHVFVQGGAGAVGSMAVQMCKAWGAHVTTTCHSSEVAAARSIGADEVLAFDVAGLPTQRGAFDVVFCTANADEQEQLLDLLKPGAGAAYVTVIHPTLKLTDDLGVEEGLKRAQEIREALALRLASIGATVTWVMFKPNPDALAELSRLLAAGQLRPLINREITLAGMAAGQAAVEAGAVGKFVVRIGEAP